MDRESMLEEPIRLGANRSGPLAIADPVSYVWMPTGADPFYAEVEHLVREWADVTRAILMRRKAAQ